MLDDIGAHNFISSVQQIAYSRAAVRSLARLRGPDRLLRLRVGDWRIVMRDADRLEILHIAACGGAYKE